MKKIILVLAASCLLSSCGSETRSDQPSVPIMAEVAKTGSGSNNSVVKVCDGDRLIYAIRDYNSAALAVVENAPECRR